MATNIEQQQQLNDLMKEFVKLTQEATSGIKQMFASAEKVAKEFEKVDPGDVAKGWSEIGDALEEVQEKMSETGDISEEVREKVGAAIQESADKAGNMTDAVGKIPPLLQKIAVAGGVFSGFLSGLKLSVGAIGNFIDAAGGILGTLTQLAVSILTFPFKVLEGLLGMGGGGGGGGLAEALNEVRKEFGSLKKDAGGAIRTMARSMRGELAETGLRVRRVFGNLADKLKFMLEYAKNIGPVFDVIRDQFARNAEAVGAYFKGLGLLEEGQRAFAERAQATGTQVTEQLRQIANFSLRMGADFGLTAKLLSREMGEMAKDFKTFGHLSIKELAQTAVYARKLGLEVKALGGIMEKYLNFEDAAQGAAQLSQAFGVNVDALALMKAQNPAEQVDMIRKAFFQAGRSIEGMTRQERKLLATQTGLEEANLDLVFSAKNQAFSYDQVKKSGDAAAKSQMSQEEAMRKLRDSIERLVKGGGGTNFKGFIDAFVKGFARGIRTTHEFRRFLRGLKRSVWQTFYAGREVGRAFVKLFPGVSKFFIGLRGIFDPKKFRVLRKGVVEVFKQFFRDLDFQKFMKGIQKAFFNYFDMTKPAAQKVVEGVKEFTRAFVRIFTQVLKEGIQGATKVFRFLLDLLTGKANLSALTTGAGGIGGWILQNVIDPIVDVLQKEGPALGEAIWDLLKFAWKKASGLVMDNIGWISLFLFGPAVFKGLVNGVVAAVGTSFVEGVTKVFLGGAGGFLVKAGQAFLRGWGYEILTKNSPRLAKILGQSVQGAAQTAQAAGGAAATANQAVQSAGVSRSLIPKLALLGLVMVALAGMIGLMAFAFKSAGLTIADFKTTAVALGLAAGMMLAVAGTMVVLSSVGSIMTGSKGTAALALAAGLAAVVALAAALAWGMKEMTDLFQGVSIGQVATAAAGIGAAALLAVGVSAAIIPLMAAGVLVANPLSLAALGVGLLAVGGLAYGLGRAAKEAVESLGDLDPGKLAKTATVMTGMAIFVTAIGAMMVALTAGGAILATPFGGYAFETGIESFVGVISVLKTQMFSVIGMVQGIPTDQGFIKKLEVFTNIVSALGSVAGVMSTVLAAVTPSFSELLFWREGGEESVAGKIGQLAQFISVMKVQMLALVQGVLDIGGEHTAALQKAQPLIQVLGAIGTLMTALSGPADMLKSAPILGNIIPDVSLKITGMTQFLLVAGHTIKGLLQTVAREVFPILTFAGTVLSPQQLTVFKGFSEVLGGISVLIRAFTATALTGVLSRAADEDPAKFQKLINNYGKTINAVVTALTKSGQGGKSFFGHVSGMIAELIGALGGLNEGQIKSAQAVAPIISSMFQFLSSITSLLTNLPAVGGGSATSLDSLTKNIDPIIDGIGRVFDSIKNTAVTLLKDAVSITSTISPSQAKNMKGAFEALKGFFEALQGIPALISSLRESTGAGDDPRKGAQAVTAYLQAFQGNTSLFSVLGTVITQLKDQLSGIEDTRDLQTKIKVAGAALGAVRTIGEVLKTWSGEDGQPMQFQGAVTEQVSLAVDAMLKSVNTISDQLRKVSVPNLTADLKALGGTLGIGASQNYEIKNRHFNITINLEVIMRSDQIEQALVNSKSRVLIGDR